MPSCFLPSLPFAQAQRRTPSHAHSARAIAAVCCAIACSGEGTTERNNGVTAPASSADPLAETAVPEDTGSIDENGELVLDDLTDGDAIFLSAGITGEWFTYSDGTSAIVPPDHTGLGVVDGEAHVTGQGFTMWGAGLSAYFRTADLSAFGSFKLRARGTGMIVVEVATPATSPAAEGGTCVGQGCFGHYSSLIQLGESYEEFELSFAALTQPSWAQPVALSLDQVISINLVAKVTNGPVSIDLWLDQLSLRTPNSL